MSSLYAKYIKERENKDILEVSNGFATYQFTDNGQSCYIEDIYIDPSSRCKGLASTLADEIAAIAKAKGCKRLLGSVCPSARNSTASLKVLLAYGFELKNSMNNLIIMEKSI